LKRGKNRAEPFKKIKISKQENEKTINKKTNKKKKKKIPPDKKNQLKKKR
jgi:hypothetical protein